MTEQKRTRKLKILKYRGFELEQLMEMKDDQVFELFTSRMRRKLNRARGLNGTYKKLVEKIAATVKTIQPGEKPKVIKTHLRDAIIMPQMVGGVVGIYNGKEYKEVEIKFNMIGTYLGEYSITYKPTLRKVNFGKPAKKGKK